MRHRSKHTLFGRQNAINHNNNYSPTQKDNTRTSSTFTLGKNSQLTKNNNKLHSKSTYFYRWGSSHKLSSSLSYVVPSVCGLALLVGGVITINPVINPTVQVYAEESTDNPKGCSTDSSNTSACIKLVVTPNVSDSTNGAVKVGEVAYFSNNIEVSGNHLDQYYLTLNAEVGGTGELVGQDNKYATVSKVSASTMPADFSENTWGYAVSSAANTNKTTMAYNPVPSGDSANNSSYLAFKTGLNAAGFADNYKLVFAAKLGNNMPTDHYQANVYVSAVGNAENVASLGFTSGGKTITTMQEMTSTICSNGITEQQRRLVDQRDGKIYWVAKLADGNCWMTQNLDFDIPPTLSNVSSNVDGANVTTNIHKAETINEWPDYNIVNYRAYYDPGEYVYNGPTNNHGQGYACGPNDSTNNTNIGLSVCGMFSQVVATTSEDALHYHVGNYYSYSAATIGQKEGQLSATATISICPKGWRLPTGGSGGNFETLLKKYGWVNTNTSANGIGGSGIYASPLYFVYGGFVRASRLYASGYYGLYWLSMTSQYSNNSYELEFDNDVDPSGHGYAVTGSFIRCVAN